MSPYEIYEKVVGEYNPDNPPQPFYVIWFAEQRDEYLRERPEAYKNMIDGHMFEAELHRFYAWLNVKYEGRI